MTSVAQTRVIEGVSPSVAAAMVAVDADVLCEDGLLQRTCVHGIRHPVGHLSQSYRDPRTCHHQVGGLLGYTWAACDGCCAAWTASSLADAERVG